MENIRAFMTGQGLFSALDLVFTFVFIAVLFAYSVHLTLIVLAAVPFYILVTVLVRPPLQARVREKFNTGAASQQFLVETVVHRHGQILSGRAVDDAAMGGQARGLR